MTLIKVFLLFLCYSAREELVGERNRKEGESAIDITYIQRTHKQGEFYAQKVL